MRFWHERTIRKLNADAFHFWPRASQMQAEFEDVRRKAVDWRREKDRIQSEALLLSLDEMRMREFKLPSLPEGVTPVTVGRGADREVVAEQP